MRSRLLVLLALLALPAFCADNETTLRIEVKTLSDRPIDRASVIVRFVRGRNYVALGKKMRTTWELKTNQEGIAKLPSMPMGEIQVQVHAKGYQTFGQKYEINEAEKTIEVKLNPPQPQVSAHQ
jgi:hypothetical protein